MKLNRKIDTKYLWGALLSPVAGVGCGFGTALLQGFIAPILTKSIGYVNGTAAAYGLTFLALSSAVILYLDKSLKTVYPLVGAVGVLAALFARDIGTLSYLDCGDNCSGVPVQLPLFNEATSVITNVLWTLFAVCTAWYIVRLLIAGARRQSAKQTI